MVPPPWNVQGKTCLVTGATSGIGQAVAAALAARGAKVLVVARDRERGAATVGRLAAARPDAAVDLLTCDLSRTDDVRALARTVTDAHGHLDVLVNNAAVVKFARETTADGLEVGFAVNHLAPFLLTNLLLPALGVPAEARVVNVTSDNHRQVRSLPWDDLQAEREFRPLQAYNRTKLMNVLFTRVLAERVAGTGITANCLSPGFVRTGLARDARGPFGVFIRLARPFQSTPEAGARTPVQLATDPALSGVNGKYFVDGKVAEPGELGRDDDAARRLWEVSARLCDLLDDLPRGAIADTGETPPGS